MLYLDQYFVPKAFVYYISYFYSTFNTKNRENIRYYLNTLFWLADSRQSFKKNRMDHQKSVQVLWWVLIKVFFDRLHYQSLTKIFVQEYFDSVNGALEVGDKNGIRDFFLYYWKGQRWGVK